ncbi:MAG: hypothetical protein ACR652_02710 [Methylocystis sp.]|uniref:hypothetical protein n=1 Tax=Methylocystis sp. TaxID=1911079 RepID=UPI003DA336D7
MNALNDIVEWCRQERQRSKKLILALESGRSRHAEDRGHGWVDVTTATLSRLKLHVAELDELLGEYEAERSAGADTPSHKEGRSI